MSSHTRLANFSPVSTTIRRRADILPALRETTFKELIEALGFRSDFADTVVARYPMATPETYLPYLVWYLENEPEWKWWSRRDEYMHLPDICAWFRYGRGGCEEAYTYLSPKSLMQAVLYASDDWARVEPEFNRLIECHPSFSQYTDGGGGRQQRFARSLGLPPLETLRKLLEMEMMDA